MRVLHVIGSLIHGGAEALLYRMATHPSTTEHRIVSFGPAAHYSPLLAEAGVVVDHLDATSPIDGPRALTRLVKIVKEARPDVIQSWMYRANVLGGLSGKLAGVPVVWGIHCSSFEHLSLLSRSWVYASAAMAGGVPSRIINCSARSAEIHARIGFDRAPVDVVFNGYDTSFFYPDPQRRAALRAQLGISDDQFLIGNVSRWHAQKDHGTLIRALQAMKAGGVGGWKCILVGRDLDDANPQLRELVAAADLTDEVACLGPRSDIDDVMRVLDLHVLSSAFGEAFPNVVAEGMASHTPSVVTDVGDSAYLVDKTGWVAPPSDPLCLARHIEAALEEWRDRPAEWLARGEAARARVEQNFTFERMIANYERIWFEVVGDTVK